MRPLLASALALVLTASGALGADVKPLPPGKPAGVHHAALAGSTLFLLLGAAAIAGGIAIAVSNNNGHGVTTTTNTSP